MTFDEILREKLRPIAKGEASYTMLGHTITDEVIDKKIEKLMEIIAKDVIDNIQMKINKKEREYKLSGGSDG